MNIFGSAAELRPAIEQLIDHALRIPPTREHDVV